MTIDKTTGGNFFEDFQRGSTIRHAVPRTIWDGDMALYIALSIPLGVVAAVTRGRFPDLLIRFLATAGLGSAITDDYASPFKFTGTIHSVTVDVSGELIEDSEAELRVHMARQ